MCSVPQLKVELVYFAITVSYTVHDLELTGALQYQRHFLCIIMDGLDLFFFFPYISVYLYYHIWGFKKLTAVIKIRILTRKLYKHSVVLLSGISTRLVDIWVSSELSVFGKYNNWSVTVNRA